MESHPVTLAPPALSRAGQLAVLLFVFALSLAPRIVQYREWIAHPAEYFSDGVPVSSSDSYRFFRHAEMLADASLPEERDPKRFYPTGVPIGRVSALPAVMVALARATGLTIPIAGILLSILLSSLFVFPLVLYLERLRAPLAGLFAAIIGSFAPAYYARTSPVFVDTDGGNVFFFWATALAMLGTTAERGRGLLAASLGGALLHAFVSWYAQPGLLPVFTGALALHLLVGRTPWRSALARLAVFVLFASPLIFFEALGDLWSFVDRYLWSRDLDPRAVSGPLTFPSVIAEIAELRRVPLLQALGLASGNPGLTLIGLAGFALFLRTHWRHCAPMIPMLMLAGLGFTSGQRFLMFVGPFVGIGIGTILAQEIKRWIGTRWKDLAPSARAVRIYAAVFVAMAGVVPMTAFFETVAANVRVQDLDALQRIRGQLPENAVIAHVWGRGYMVTALTGAATFNDGEDPDPIVEQLFARGLTDTDPKVLHDVVAFLAGHERPTIDALASEAGSYAGLLGRIAAARPPDDARLYVLFTPYMFDTFTTIHRKGRHDFETGRSPAAAGYDVRSCSHEAAALRCRKPGKADIVLDPEAGVLNHRIPLHTLVRVDAGQVAEELVIEPASAMRVQLFQPGPNATEMTLHIPGAEIFESNFNQMYWLGRFDERLFRLVFDAFPDARLYELIGR